MIRINLANTGEGSQTDIWYILDVAVLLLVLGAGYFGVQYYMSLAKESIEIVNAETQSIRASLDKLKADIARFNTLEADIARLKEKVNAIKSITVSSFDRYKPLIILEHLQILQPDGVWYDTLKMTDSKIEIAGGAFDNILVAEFLTALESTKTQEVDPTDLRTQVYFDPYKLIKTESSEDNTSSGGNIFSTKFSVEIGFKSRTHEQIGNVNSKELAVNNVRGN